MIIKWQDTKVSNDETYHHYQQKHFYQKTFKKVLKYHAPGLAPVVDETGAYHININADAIYSARYLQTFGYYENLAAVESASGWFHIDINGHPIYQTRYAWCGNFQEELCTVKDKVSNCYFHIDRTGKRIYTDNYCYAGDFRDGIAVVCANNGLHTHINQYGEYLHHQWFLNLDVFHKSVARACDEQGWFHIDKRGKALYQKRFKAIEPYYNNIAHVECFDGSLKTIDLDGNTVTVIREKKNNLLGELSANLVGFWQTQTIFAAVKLKLFDAIPNDLENISSSIKINNRNCMRLLRALQELNLVYSKNNKWYLTDKGQLLTPTETSVMAAAAIVWGDSHYRQWLNLTNCLLETANRENHYFEKLACDDYLLPIYQHAINGYAKHDYQSIINLIDWKKHHYIIDAGGGQGSLLHSLLTQYSKLNGALLEMPEVVNLIKQKHPQCNYYGVDFFQSWPCQADAILLTRVLHDWSDEQALVILEQAKKALLPDGKIYIVEMILPYNSAAGGLLDLNMLVMTNGCERNLLQWQTLFNTAKLNLINNQNVSSIVNLMTVST